MPQPPRPSSTTSSQSAPAPADGMSPASAGALAAGVAAVPATAAAAQPAQANAQIVARLAEAAARIIAAFMKALLRRGKRLDVYIRQRVREQYPDATDDEVTRLAALEVEYEKEFQRKVQERMARDVPAALRLPEAERRRALQVILDRERRYVEAREQAMLERALGAAERRHLRKASPQGAYWKLSDRVKEHTADCLAMGEKFWPWAVLDRLHPPRHHGCPCRLIGLDDAISRGLMTMRDIPDPADALRRARRLEKQWEELDEVGVDARDVADWVLALEEAEQTRERGESRRHAERWEEGTTKGGEFKPRRGGRPGRPTLSGVVGRGRRRALAKALPKLPKAPALSRSDGDWVWVKGRLTRIPEGPWEKRIDGHVYASPPGGTNVYRDGELALEAGETPRHPDLQRPPKVRSDRARRPMVLTTEQQQARAEIARRQDVDAQRVHRDAEAALRRGDPNDPPVDVGEYVTDAVAGLERAGFGLGLARRSEIALAHPSGASLRLSIDRGEVAGVQWESDGGPHGARRPSSGPPADLASLAGDLMATADRVAAGADAPVLLRVVREDDAMGPLSATRDRTGAVDVGTGVAATIAAAGRAKAEGRELTDRERRDVYAAYVNTHVATIGGVNPPSAATRGAATSRLEAALNAELGRIVARERLQAHGLDDVVGWADEHPDALAAQGGARPERAALAALLDDGGIRGHEDRLQFLTRLKMHADPETRVNVLADRLVSAGHVEDPSRAREHVEATLETAGRDLRPDEFDSLLDAGEPAHPDAPAGYDPPPAVPSRSRTDALRAVAGAEVANVAELALDGDAGARWELERRIGAAPGSEEAAAIRRTVPGLTPADPPDADRDLPLVAGHVAAAKPTPSHGGLERVPPVASASTGIRLEATDRGELQETTGGFGQGVYFTSGTEASQVGASAASAYPAGVNLDGATLYRVRDASDAAQLEAALRRIAARDGDPRELAALLPPASDGERSAVRAEAAITDAFADRSFRDPAAAVMGALGYDGVDSRHVPAFDTQARSSVLFAPRRGSFDTSGPEAAPHLIAAADVDGFLSDAPEGSVTGVFHHVTYDAGGVLAGGFSAKDGAPGPLGRGVYAASQPVEGARPGSTVQVAVKLARPLELPDGWDGGEALPGGVASPSEVGGEEFGRSVRELGYDGVVAPSPGGRSVVALSPDDSVRVIEPVSASPAAGGAVVNGRAGRWVWVRGTYRHIPHGEAWEETVDGVTFRSPEGSTFVYRREGDGPEELVAKPRWNGHPDVRNPSRGGTRRGDAPRRPVAEPPVAPDRPEVGWRVALDDGTTGVVADLPDGGNVAVELPDGSRRVVAPATVRVVDRGTPTPQIGPAIGETPWQTLVAADRPGSAGGEVVPGVRYTGDPGQIVNTAKIAAGELLVGAPFFDLDARARAFQIDLAMGRGLALAVNDDDGARQRFGDLWTSDRFQASEGGRTLALDRYSLDAAIAQGYARLRATDWENHAARYPDALRAVALEAQERGYPLSPDVAAWARGRIGGPTPEPPNRGSELAALLLPLDGEARERTLRDRGFAAAGLTGAPTTWRRVDDDGITSVTVTDDGVVGAHVPWRDPGADLDAPGRDVIRQLEGAPLDADGLRRAGYERFGTAYPGRGRSIQMFAHPDRPDHVLWTESELGDAGTWQVRRVAYGLGDRTQQMQYLQYRVSQDPTGAPEGMDWALLRGAMVAGGWSAQADPPGRWRRVVRPRSADEATVAEVQVTLAGGAVQAVRVPDGFDGEAATREYRERLRAREARVTALGERIRLRVNAGAEPFESGDAADEAHDALRGQGFAPSGSERRLQNGGVSQTWKNSTTGAKLIVRMGREDPDTGVRLVIPQTRVERGRADYGRAMIDRLPENVEEFAADIMGWGDEIARQHGVRNNVRLVRWATTSNDGTDSSDHAGWHRMTDGLIVMGQDAGPALTRYLRQRAAGDTLTAVERRSVYATYRLAAHEATHAVNDAARDGYSDQDGSKGIEEAITEELAHVQAARLLRRHGADDILDAARAAQQQWLDQNDPSGVHSVRGVYLGYRQRFGELVERMGPLSNDERIELFETWAYRMSGAERRRDMARRIVAQEGGSEDAVLAEITAQMRGSTDLRGNAIQRFRPILRADFSRAGAPDAPDAPERPDAPAGFSRNERVRVTPQRGRAFQGRIVEIDDAGRLKVRKIGRGEEVWVDPARAAYLDGSRPGVAPPTPDTAPDPPAATVELRNGGVAAAGARTRGRVSGQLSTVLAVEPNGRVKIRRDDGSEYAAMPSELDLVAITDEGRELGMRSRVVLPDGRRAVVTGIRWTAADQPEVKLGRADTWVPARPLQLLDDDGAVRRDLAVVRRRDGGEVTLVRGDTALYRGETVTLTGQRAEAWPNPTVAVTARTAGGRELIVTPADLRLVGEVPDVSAFRPDADTYTRLAQQHYDRRASAGRTAQALAQPLSEQIADDFAAYLRAKNATEFRHPSGRGGREVPVYNGRATPADQVFALAYRDAFASQEAHDRLEREQPKVYEAAKEVAAAAALPWPNWRDRVPPSPPAPALPAGSMFSEPVLRAAWTGTFGRRGYRAVVRDVVTRDGAATVTGRIRDADGQLIGVFERRVRLDAAGEPFVYHAYLRLEPGAQGGGFASAFNAHAEAVYRAKGVKAVRVSANIDVGGYTWAATGFNWDVGTGSPEDVAIRRSQQCIRMYRAGQHRLTAEQRSAVEARLWNGPQDGPLRPGYHLINAWDLAHFGGGDHAIGKALLLGTSWAGIKPLVGPDQPPAER